MKIAFAGGPASGKTETLYGIRRRLNVEHIKDVVFLPEVATSFLTNQPKIVKVLNKEILLDYYIFRTEIHVETIVESYNPELVIICDRGISDVYAFLPQKTANKVVGNYTKKVLNNYDLVLFFENDTTGRNWFSDNKTRTHMSLRKIQKLNEATKRAWCEHNKNIVLIPQFSSIDEKIVYVANIINSYLERNIFLI